MRTSAEGRVDQKNGNGFKTQEYGVSVWGESRKSLDAKLQVEDTQRQVCVNYLERLFRVLPRAAHQRLYHTAEVIFGRRGPLPKGAEFMV